MWLGRAGNMVELPQLQPDVAVDENRGGVVHTSVAGGVTVQNMYRDVKRVYSVPWKYIADEDMADLLAFSQGHYGPGPFILITELDRNLLEANQSSGTDQRGTTYGFAPTHGTVSSVAGGYKGLRQLNWQLPASAGATPSLKLTWKGNTAGIPAMPDQKYVFSTWVKASVATNIELKMSYRTATNTVIGETAWGSVSVGTSWTRLDVAGESASGTQCIAPLIVMNSAPASQLISVDSPQLEFGLAATDWQPGLGVPYVSITNVPRVYAMSGWQNPGNVQFTEVG